MARRLDRDEWRLCVAALEGRRDHHGIARVGCPLCERVRGRLDAKKSLYCHDDGGFVCFRCGAAGALPGSANAAERRARASLRGGASGFGDRLLAWLAAGGHGDAPGWDADEETQEGDEEGSDALGHRRAGYRGPAIPLPPGIAPATADDPLASSFAAVCAGHFNPGAPQRFPPRASVAAPAMPRLPPLAALQRPATTTTATATTPTAPPAHSLPRLAPLGLWDAAPGDALPPLTPEWTIPQGTDANTPWWPWQLPPPGFRRLYAEDRFVVTDRGIVDPLDAALTPYREYVATRQRRADGSVGLDRAVAELAGLGACLTGPLRGYLIAPVWSPDGASWWGWVARIVERDPTRAERGRPPQDTYRFAPRMPWHTFLDGQSVLAVETDSPAFVVEGFFDRLHLYPDGVATLSKPTPAQLAILARSKRPVVLLPDGDAWEAAVYQAAALRAEGVRAGVVRLPPRVDPDEVPESTLRDAGWYALRSLEPVCLAFDDTSIATAPRG